MLKFQVILKSLYHALLNTIKHDGVEHAGYIAFLALLGLFPFLVFLSAVGSYIAYFIEQVNISKEFVKLLLSNIPNNIIIGITPRMNEIISGPPQSLLKLAVVGTIWTSSSIVEALRTILNRANRILSPPTYILRRLLSIAQLLIITTVIVITMTALALIPVSLFAKFQILWIYTRYIVISLLLLFAVSSLYIMIPNDTQKLRDILPGAVVVVILEIISVKIISIYIQTFEEMSIIYGSLAGIIVSLIFFYISGICFVYGAEFNYSLKENRLNV